MSIHLDDPLTLIAIAVTLLIILLVMLGGNIKVGNVTVGNPIARILASITDKERQGAQAGNDIQKSVSEPPKSDSHPDPYKNLHSFHAITTVLAVTTKDGKLYDATLKEASTRAELFYGKAPGTAKEHLHGKTGEELMELLNKFVDPDLFTIFVEDQVKLFKNYTEGKSAFADVPVIFNEKHPDYAGRAFLPVIVSRGELKQQGTKFFERFMQIAYLDMENFIEPVKIYREHKEGQSKLKDVDGG